MSVLFTRRGPAPIIGTSASDLEIGSSVFLNVNSVPTEFLVVHQGKPSALYDDSCNGTWLLMKDCYKDMGFHSSYNSYYQGGDIAHTYLNGTFLGLLDNNIRNVVKQAKIPYRPSYGTSMVVSSGANGLPANVFALSCYELGWTSAFNSYIPEDGACLDYFRGTESTDARRIAYYNGVAKDWWTRTPCAANNYAVWYVAAGGYCSSVGYNSVKFVRPALILQSNALFNSNGEFVGVA